MAGILKGVREWRLSKEVGKEASGELICNYMLSIDKSQTITCDLPVTKD